MQLTGTPVRLRRQTGINQQAFNVKRTISGWAALLLASSVAADVYKSVDPSGRITYTDRPVEGSVRADLPPIGVIDTPDAPGAQPGPAPQEAERAKVAAARKQWLQNQIIEEQRKLGEAKLALEEGKANPEVYQTTVVGADGQARQVTRRAYARYQEKIERLQADVDSHENNLVVLRNELEKLQ